MGRGGSKNNGERRIWTRKPLRLENERTRKTKQNKTPQEQYSKCPEKQNKTNETNRFGSIIGAKSAILAPSLSCTLRSHPTAPGFCTSPTAPDLSLAALVVLSLASVGAVRRMPNLCDVVWKEVGRMG